MTIHAHPHPAARETLKLCEVGSPALDDQQFWIEDWWDRVIEKSWRECSGNPAALMYAIRVDAKGLPNDDEVVYGKVNGMGFLLHITELPWP